MITETREIYKCEHCRKMYQVKSACIRHELRCDKNPETHRACYGCNFLKEERVDVNFIAMQPYGEDEYTEEKKILFCSKLNVYKYPPKIEHSLRGAYLQEDIGDGEVANEPMPKDCPHSNYEFDLGF